MSSWSSQGVLAWLQADSVGLDPWVLPPDGDPVPFFASAGDEFFATFSPDGNWLAYTSDQSGRQEVYVRPYPGPEPETRISVNGGEDVAWSRDGRQIYFTGPRGLMAVDVTPGADFQRGRPTPLIEPWLSRCYPVRCYDVFPDGSFVTTVQDDDRSWLEQFGATELHVVLNWFEELKARVGN